LAQLGLGTRRVLPLDMIPLTDAAEAFAELVPQAPRQPEILYRDERWLVIAKPPHLSLGPQRYGAAASLLARVQAVSGLERAVSLQPLDAGVSGACLFAREPGAGGSRSDAQPRFTFRALLSGVTHAKGSLRKHRRKAGAAIEVAHYRRERVVSTHSLVRIVTEDPAPVWIQERLAQLRHPVLGDERHGNIAANRYFEARYGLDRTFLHCVEIELRSQERSFSVSCELAPDLAVVLEQLERTRPE
jgi:23S rRNA-/tRNA-specific pseudouridylate synthase